MQRNKFCCSITTSKVRPIVNPLVLVGVHKCNAYSNKLAKEKNNEGKSNIKEAYFDSTH